MLKDVPAAVFATMPRHSRSLVFASCALQPGHGKTFLQLYAVSKSHSESETDDAALMLAIFVPSRDHKHSKLLRQRTLALGTVSLDSATTHMPDVMWLLPQQHKAPVIIYHGADWGQGNGEYVFRVFSRISRQATYTSFSAPATAQANPSHTHLIKSTREGFMYVSEIHGSIHGEQVEPLYWNGTKFEMARKTKPHAEGQASLPSAPPNPYTHFCNSNH